MNETREALRTLAAMAKVLRQPLSLLEQPRSAEPLSLPPAPAVPLPDPAFLEGLRRSLRAACDRNRLADVPRRELRMAPMVFWNGTPEAATFPGLLELYLENAARRQAWLRQLLESWLRDFGPDRARIGDTGKALGRLLATASAPRLTLWRDAHATYQLFDAASGPRTLGGALLLGQPPVPIILAQTGMDDALRADGQFFRIAVGSLLASLPAALRSSDAELAWARAVEVLEASRTTLDRQGRTIQRPELRFRDLVGDVAKACLAPWLDGGTPRLPRRTVGDFLLRMIGDPRLNPQGWAKAGQAETALMRAWLSERTLEAFLALIERSNDDRQLRYRWAFWRACLRARPDAEVWVVLGRDLAQRAAATKDLAGGFGTMSGVGRNGDQAVLLLKLGAVVLSEWSNVGKVRAWDAGHQDCPPLYRSTYDADDLRADCLPFPPDPATGKGTPSFGGLSHHGPEDFLWQGRAAEFLRNKIGLRLTRKDYTP